MKFDFLSKLPAARNRFAVNSINLVLCELQTFALMHARIPIHSKQCLCVANFYFQWEFDSPKCIAVK